MEVLAITLGLFGIVINLVAINYTLARIAQALEERK
jgi:hypothetical protein